MQPALVRSFSRLSILNLDSSAPGEGGAKRRARARMPKHWAYLPSSGPFLMLALSGSRSPRATFSRREKDWPARFPGYFGQHCLEGGPRSFSEITPKPRFVNIQTLHSLIRTL